MQTSEDRITILLWETLAVLFIFIVHVWGCWNYDVLIVLMDEFGYWEHAAAFAGYDWKAVMETAPWYSFGYSILLVPLFFLCERMTSMYRTAILLNGAMAVGIYFVVKALLCRFYSNATAKMKIMLAVTVSLYSAYVGQSKIAWAEMAVVFSFWLLLFTFLIALEKGSLGWSVTASVFAGICYCVHNRMITVMIALLLTVLLMRCTKRISWKRLAAFLFPMIVVYVFSVWMKSLLQQDLTGATGLEYSLNDIPSRAWKMKAFFSMEGFRNALQSALGELVYVNLSTFTFGILGIYYAIKELLVRLIRRKKEEQDKSYFLLFVLLSFFGEWGVSTLVNMPANKDIGEKPVTYLYYGRYVDGVIGIFILLGLIYIVQHRKKLVFWEALLCNSLLLGGTIVVYRYALLWNNELMNSICIPGMWYADRIDGLNVIVYTITIEIMMLVVLYIYLHDNKISRNKPRVWLCGFLTALFLIVGISYSIVRIGAFREHKEGVFAWIEKYVGEEDIYCLEDERAKYFVQAELYDKEIHLIQEEEIEYLGENCFMITEQILEIKGLHLCIRNQKYHVYITEGETYQELQKYHLALKE